MSVRVQDLKQIFEAVVIFIIKLSILCKLSSKKFQEIKKRDTGKQKQPLNESLNKYMVYSFSNSY